MTNEEMKQRIVELENKAKKMESLLVRCAGYIGEGSLVEEILNTVFPITVRNFL